MACFKNKYHVYVFLLFIVVKMFCAKERGDNLHWILLEFRMYSPAFLPSTCVLPEARVSPSTWCAEPLLTRAQGESTAVAHADHRGFGDTTRCSFASQDWLFPKLMLMGLLQCWHIKITREVNCKSWNIMHYWRTASSDLLCLKWCQN